MNKEKNWSVGRKLLGLAMGLTLAFTLTGCQGQGSAGDAVAPAVDNTPKTAEEVYKQYKDQKQENYKLSGTMDVKMSGGDAQGNTVEMPLTESMDMDWAGDFSHANITMEMTYQGQTISQDTEMYTDASGDQAVIYVKDPSTGSWVKTTSAKSDSSWQGDIELSDDALKNADFQTTDDGYKVTVAFADIMSSEEGESTFSQMLKNTSGVVDEKELKKMVADTKMTLNFDKDCKLVSMKVDDMSLTLQGGAAKADYKMDFTFSDYGKVDEASAKVPDDVAASAIDAGSADATTLTTQQ